MSDRTSSKRPIHALCQRFIATRGVTANRGPTPLPTTAQPPPMAQNMDDGGAYAAHPIQVPASAEANYASSASSNTDPAEESDMDELFQVGMGPWQEGGYFDWRAGSPQSTSPEPTWTPESLESDLEAFLSGSSAYSSRVQTPALSEPESYVPSPSIGRSSTPELVVEDASSQRTRTTPDPVYDGVVPSDPGTTDASTEFPMPTLEQFASFVSSMQEEDVLRRSSSASSSSHSTGALFPGASSSAPAWTWYPGIPSLPVAGPSLSSESVERGETPSKKLGKRRSREAHTRTPDPCAGDFEPSLKPGISCPNQCGKTLSTQQILSRHRKRCDQVTNGQAEELNGQDSNQALPGHICPLCEKPLSRSDALKRHVRTQHADHPLAASCQKRDRSRRGNGLAPTPSNITAGDSNRQPPVALTTPLVFSGPSSSVLVPGLEFLTGPPSMATQQPLGHAWAPTPVASGPSSSVLVPGHEFLTGPPSMATQQPLGHAWAPTPVASGSGSSALVPQPQFTTEPPSMASRYWPESTWSPAFVASGTGPSARITLDPAPTWGTLTGSPEPTVDSRPLKRARRT